MTLYTANDDFIQTLDRPWEHLKGSSGVHRTNFFLVEGLLSAAHAFAKRHSMISQKVESIGHWICFCNLSNTRNVIKFVFPTLSFQSSQRSELSMLLTDWLLCFVRFCIFLLYKVLVITFNAISWCFLLYTESDRIVHMLFNPHVKNLGLSLQMVCFR